MEVGWAGVEAEERRAARMGRDEDAKAEAEENARQVIYHNALKFMFHVYDSVIN